MLRFLFAMVLLGALLATPASAVEVSADDLLDEYVITGAVVLDPSYSAALEAATDCVDCHWRIVRICGLGSLDDRRGCDQLPVVCPADVAEVWKSVAPELPPVGDPQWQYRGVMCLNHAPVTPATVAGAVPEIARRSVPQLRPGSRPAGTTLTNLPTGFFSGQSADVLLEPVQIANAVVQIHLAPVWSWDFGHGAPLTTSEPGSAGHGLLHRFPRRGVYRVRVVCTWHASYDINGIAGFHTDDIHQEAWFDVRVKEARRFLTQHRSNP